MKVSTVLYSSKLSNIAKHQNLKNLCMLNFLIHESRINWHFIKRDIFAIIFPGIVFTAHALLVSSASLSEWIYSIVFSFIYFWLLLTFFCTSNQVIGIEEDKQNKPDRPIPAGLVSYRGGLIRCIISGFAAILLGMALSIVEFSILFILCSLFHNFHNWGHHWIGKNILVAIGMFATLSAGWELVIPLTSDIMIWISVLCVTWIFLAHIQDLRDIAGDKQIGRRTVPIELGEQFCRCQLAISFAAFPFIIYMALNYLIHARIDSILWGLIFVLSWIITARVIFCRTYAADNNSYSMFLILYGVILIANLCFASP